MENPINDQVCDSRDLIEYKDFNIFAEVLF